MNDIPLQPPTVAPRPGRQTPARLRAGGPPRLLVFPVLLNVWPLLLLISQKALIPFGFLLLGVGSRVTRRNLVIAASLIAAGAVYLLWAPRNEYGVTHYVGFALFVASIPLINAAVRVSRGRLIKWLSILTVLNCALAFILYFFEIDVSQLRGLNRIIGDDASTHRVYFETTSLLAITSLRFIRQRWFRWACGILVLSYALFLAKSVFVILLFILNRVAHRALVGSIQSRLAIMFGIGVVALGAPVVIAIARPDFALSVGMKIIQLQTVLAEAPSFLHGAGWGYVIDAIISSPTQPYQVEMQLPMLVMQVGIPMLTLLALGMLLQFRSISGNWLATSVRCMTYFVVGFVNPWLFMPSWYLTVALMYPQFDRKKK